MNKYNMDIKEMLTVLNKKSGVQGISGVSSDFRDLEEAAAQGNQRAALALEAFQYSVRKFVGAYAAAMGGVDAIIFTAGVGENDAATRMAIASGLEFMGVKMDAEANNVRGKDTVISAADSKVKVLLIPTNEAHDRPRHCRDRRQVNFLHCSIPAVPVRPWGCLFFPCFPKLYTH